MTTVEILLNQIIFLRPAFTGPPLRMEAGKPVTGFPSFARVIQEDIIPLLEEIPTTIMLRWRRSSVRSIWRHWLGQLVRREEPVNENGAAWPVGCWMD